MTTQTIKVESLRSLYLIPALGDCALASATGFVVTHGGAPYLITNWHVVAGRNPHTGEPLDQRLALTPDRLHVLHSLTQVGTWQARVEPLFGGDGNPLWLEYPVHLRKIDIIALPLTQLTDVQLYPYDTGQPE